MDAVPSIAVEVPASAGHRYFLSWMSGLEHEADFWDDIFRTRGLEWRDEFHARLQPSRPVAGYLERAVADCDRTPMAILDVGAGPFSKLGNFQWNRPVEFHAVDPLAPYYASLIKREKLTPPVWTQVGFAEDLSALFGSGNFDIVHCSNALDHSLDPLRGIREMVKVLRVGGTAVLFHSPHEAVNANYIGLHQWNFDVKDGRALLWNREHRHDLAELLSPHCTVTAELVTEGGNPNVLVSVRKHSELNLANESAENSARMRDLLTAIVDFSLQRPAPVTARQRLRRDLRKFLLDHAPVLMAGYRGARRAIDSRLPLASKSEA